MDWTQPRRPPGPLYLPAGTFSTVFESTLGYRGSSGNISLKRPKQDPKLLPAGRRFHSKFWICLLNVLVLLGRIELPTSSLPMIKAFPTAYPHYLAFSPAGWLFVAHKIGS